MVYWSIAFDITLIGTGITMATDSRAIRALGRFLAEPDEPDRLPEVVACGLEVLRPLCDLLRVDQPIARAETLERALKAILKAAMEKDLCGDDARRIALCQKDLGFLFKYKSYAVKAATSLGYSVFLQNQGAGFSFQRHTTHKTEVFHILDVKPGGYVFLCAYADWVQVYEENAFAQWVAGKMDDRFDRFRFVPRPGDVFVISELGIVHSVVGCVLEEFATVSTDMVDRLYDQNAGRSIPLCFARLPAERELLRIESPTTNRLVDILSPTATLTLISPTRITGGSRITLVDSFVGATRCFVDSGAEIPPARDEFRATVIRVVAGQGAIFVGDEGEVKNRGDVSVLFRPGDLFMVPRGAFFAVRCQNGQQVEYTEHRVAPSAAFV